MALNFEKATEEEIGIYSVEDGDFLGTISWYDGQYILDAEKFFFVEELKEIVAYMEKLNGD